MPKGGSRREACREKMHPAAGGAGAGRRSVRLHRVRLLRGAAVHPAPHGAGVHRTLPAAGQPHLPGLRVRIPLRRAEHPVRADGGSGGRRPAGGAGVPAPQRRRKASEDHGVPPGRRRQLQPAVHHREQRHRRGQRVLSGSQRRRPPGADRGLAHQRRCPDAGGLLHRAGAGGPHVLRISTATALPACW